ncbi:hypothetical protein PCC7418_0812 [Halothece sp. PCC 7418]|uniref:hypothetical protein n=1 Tax=Halothece sp. (strain PCC 7418) TaxID=65093 RepID=UPI0002A07702|nr:hypothetical protein [Halothece sp. PCC 7418]AFZ43027.1 hypothetical protein PCC7418_0812 [Halothece sp. PCC 7418]
MNIRGVLAGGLSLTSLVFLVSSDTQFAQGQCVQADIAVQYNISGSKQPTERSNDVEMQSNGSCRGNASITTGVQGHRGGRDSVRQNRTVRHRFQGDDSEGYSREPTVQIQSNPQIDVFNPADDR